MKEIKDYIDYYNEFIKEWDKDPEACIQENIYTNYYIGGIKLDSGKDKSKTKLVAEALPEPYLGNPYNCSAVFINLNPGGAMDCLQKRGTGKFITEGNAVKNYYEFAKDFPYSKKNKYDTNNGGVLFWNKRKDWINRLLSIVKSEKFESEREPFALELCPWHSNGFGGFKSNDEFKSYIKEYVFDFAEKVIDNSELGFAISVGKSVKLLLQELGVKAIEIKNEELVPLKKDNRPIRREYCYFELSNGKKLLNTWAPGGNKPPSPAWTYFEEQLIFDLF